jgi:uncharacterized membrane protein YtjA (UPF0391 family)
VVPDLCGVVEAVILCGPNQIVEVALGFSGFAGAANGIAKLFFFVFLAAFAISIFANRR